MLKQYQLILKSYKQQKEKYSFYYVRFILNVHVRYNKL